MSNRPRPQSIMSNMSTRSRSNSRLRAPMREVPAKLARSLSRTRSCSPSAPNRRIAKLNMYLARAAANSSQDLHHMGDLSANAACTIPTRRWDGNQRTTMKWDSIRKDPELWFAGGDCLIHFYERGLSQRGASLRVYFSDIESSNCGPFLQRYYSDPFLDSASASPEARVCSDASGYFDEQKPSIKHEFFIPAPTYLSREEAYQHHLTTRNFFAWMFEKPLVGDRLGRTLISLLGRINEYRPDPIDNKDDILVYMDDQGYTDFRDCPDHALAVLQFAEVIQHRELWTDAFVHCTGMNDQLDASAEFEHVSRASKALITRANIEMDLRLERAGRSLKNFLEDDLSGAYLGLTKDAQLHMERFRSFLHTYYIAQHCYWPPSAAAEGSESFPAAVYKSMYFEFRSLYDYLVDSSSSTLLQDNKPVDGGICVFQNVQAFDERNKYASLPYPLPLIPRVPAVSSRKTLSRLNIFASKQVDFDRRIAASDALASAANTSDTRVLKSGLVREYLRFEKLWTLKEETSLTCPDARKIRWLLVYAILQTLISVTRVPTEVCDTEGVVYPLCCQIGGTPPWKTSKPIGDRKKKEYVATVRPISLKDQIFLELGPDMDIVSAKPSPLILPIKRPKTLTPPRRVSFTNALSLRAPKPIRTKSWEILSQEHSGGVSPVSRSSSPIGIAAPVSPIPQPTTPVDPLHNFSLPTVSPGPLLHTSSFVLPIPQHSKTPEPSSPTASENGGTSSGWSNSASEDDMDHASVTGDTDPSDYGDDENEKPKKIMSRIKNKKQPQQQQQSSPKIPTKSRLRPQSQTFDIDGNASVISFAAERANPEIDVYLMS